MCVSHAINNNRHRNDMSRLRDSLSNAENCNVIVVENGVAVENWAVVENWVVGDVNEGATFIAVSTSTSTLVWDWSGRDEERSGQEKGDKSELHGGKLVGS